MNKKELADFFELFLIRIWRQYFSNTSWWCLVSNFLVCCVILHTTFFVIIPAINLHLAVFYFDQNSACLRSEYGENLWHMCLTIKWHFTIGHLHTIPRLLMRAIKTYLKPTSFKSMCYACISLYKWWWFIKTIRNLIYAIYMAITCQIYLPLIFLFTHYYYYCLSGYVLYIHLIFTFTHVLAYCIIKYFYRYWKPYKEHEYSTHIKELRMFFLYYWIWFIYLHFAYDPIDDSTNLWE